MIHPARQRDEPDRRHRLQDDSTNHATRTDDAILQIQNYLECWKQIAHYLGLARARRFDAHDENQFLELKAIIAQELELVLASQRCLSPSRDEVHAMMNNIPSLRFVEQLSEGSLRNLENQWHLIYIGWQATLGQLKAKHRKTESHAARPRQPRPWWRGISTHFRRQKPPS